MDSFSQGSVDTERQIRYGLCAQGTDYHLSWEIGRSAFQSHREVCTCHRSPLSKNIYDIYRALTTCQVKPHINPMGIREAGYRKVTAFPKAQSSDLNPGILSPERLLLSARPRSSLFCERVNERLYKPAHLSRALPFWAS